MGIKTIIYGSCVCLVAASANTNAAIYTSNAISQGWYNTNGQGGGGIGGNTNYLVGEIGATIYRNWFSFDLNSITLSAGETISSASLSVSKGTYISSDSQEVWSLSSIENTVTELMTFHPPGSTTGINIFADLADGSSYGSATITNSIAPLSTISVNLTGANALTDINASLGGQFAIGGYLSSLDNVSDEVLFSGTGGTNFLNTVLTIETTVVPVPAAVWLFGSGLIGLIGFARRKA